MRNEAQAWLRGICFLVVIMAAGWYVATGHDLASGTTFITAVGLAIAAIKK